MTDAFMLLTGLLLPTALGAIVYVAVRYPVTLPGHETAYDALPPLTVQED
jgi:hypothetical protein